MRVDPGRGSWTAEEGSEEWAKRFRLAWLSTKHDLRDAPERFAGFFKKGKEVEVWRVLTGPDGRTFATFAEFCAAPEPWGFGEPWENIKPFLLGVLSERELDLVTVAPAKKAKAGPGRGKTSSDRRNVFSKPGHDKESRLRAIAERAPEPVRELYKRDLIGQDVAAKLGPKNPTPEEAARVTEIAIALVDESKKLSTTTPKDKSAAKKRINQVAREMLGVAKPSASAPDEVAEASLEHSCEINWGAISDPELVSGVEAALLHRDASAKRALIKRLDALFLHYQPDEATQ